ncbi:MAG: hypothetical protein ACREFJ_07120 [Acetobacteraceae bacterium]
MIVLNKGSTTCQAARAIADNQIGAVPVSRAAGIADIIGGISRKK